MVNTGCDPNVAGNTSPVWQPGFRPGWRVLSVSWVNIMPSQLLSQDETMVGQGYHSFIKRWGLPLVFDLMIDENSHRTSK